MSNMKDKTADKIVLVVLPVPRTLFMILLTRDSGNAHITPAIMPTMIVKTNGIPLPLVNSHCLTILDVTK